MVGMMLLLLVGGRRVILVRSGMLYAIRDGIDDTVYRGPGFKRSRVDTGECATVAKARAVERVASLAVSFARQKRLDFLVLN